VVHECAAMDENTTRLLLSNSQHKLHALLCKISDLATFASDEECEETFLRVAHFVKRVLQLEKQAVEEREKYSTMNLEDLIGLPHVPPNETLFPQTTFSTGKMLESEPMSMKTRKRAKRPCDTPVLPPYWGIQNNPNVVEILHIGYPPLIIVFTARHALLGDHADVTMCADLPILLLLSTAKKEHKKQSKYALRKLKKAIVTFSKTTPLLNSLQGPLFELPWARESFKSKLLFAAAITTNLMRKGTKKMSEESLQ
jgi:hypothetical protein